MKLLKSAVCLLMLLHSTNLIAQQLHLRGMYLPPVRVLIIELSNVQVGLEYIGRDNRKNLSITFSSTNYKNYVRVLPTNSTKLQIGYSYFTSKAKKNPLFLAALPFYGFSEAYDGIPGSSVPPSTRNILFKSNQIGLATTLGKKFKIAGPLNLEPSLGWQFVYRESKAESYNNQSVKTSTRHFSPDFDHDPYFNLILTFDVLGLKQMQK